MRNVDRISPMMEEIATIWADTVPDWRFGQFISNFQRWHGINYGNSDIFYLEDNVMLERLKKFLAVNHDNRDCAMEEGEVWEVLRDGEVWEVHEY